jgi:hypothetical protein
MLHLSLRHRRQPPRTPPALPRPSGRPPMPPPPPLVLSAPGGCSLDLIPKFAVALLAVQYLDPPAAPLSSASSMRPTNGGWVHTPVSFGPPPDPTCTPSPPPCLRRVPDLYPDPVLPLFPTRRSKEAVTVLRRLDPHPRHDSPPPYSNSSKGLQIEASKSHLQAQLQKIEVQNWDSIPAGISIQTSILRWTPSVIQRFQ